jgi:hypothetical protein
MATTIAAVNTTRINYAEFVRITTASGVHTFCNAAANITVNSILFQGLGSLLNVADIQRDIKATSDDLNISLTGIDPSNVSLILSNDIKGSLVEVWRGFLDTDNQIIMTPTQQFFKRYQGIVNAVAINENFDTQLRQRTATCAVSCASFRMILENRISGVITNGVNWKKLHPNDTSMDRVQSIVAQYFDFGRRPKGGSQSTSSTTTVVADGGS